MTTSTSAGLRPLRGTTGQVVDLLEEWLDAHDPEPLVVETSGSTGRPKRVVLSREAVLASATAAHERLGGPGRWTLLLPPTYVAGLQVVVRALLTGVPPSVQLERTSDRSYVSLVPTQLHRLLADPTSSDLLASYDAVLIGGGALDPVLQASAAAAGVHVVTTYGSSETAGGCVYDGVPLDGVRVRIGADGRVRVGGATLFDGYLGEPGLTAEVMEDGWFVTADLGELVPGPEGAGEAGAGEPGAGESGAGEPDAGESGASEPDAGESGLAGERLRVLGRVDDMVNSGGVKVPASQVARRLREHPSLSSAEVVGVTDREWGERLVAVVVARDAAVVQGPSLGELREWVAATHPREWAPRQLVAVSAMPLLGNGKVDRLRLAELADVAELAG